MYILRFRLLLAWFIQSHYKYISIQYFQPPLIKVLILNQMSQRESLSWLGKDTSWTGSLPPQPLTSWPADFSPPGLQSSSRWPCPLLLRPESCSLCPSDRKEKHLIRFFPCRNLLKVPDDEIFSKEMFTHINSYFLIKICCMNSKDFLGHIGHLVIRAI